MDKDKLDKYEQKETEVALLTSVKIDFKQNTLLGLKMVNLSGKVEKGVYTYSLDWKV